MKPITVQSMPSHLPTAPSGTIGCTLGGASDFSSVNVPSSRPTAIRNGDRPTRSLLSGARSSSGPPQWGQPSLTAWTVGSWPG